MEEKKLFSFSKDEDASIFDDVRSEDDGCVEKQRLVMHANGLKGVDMQFNIFEGLHFVHNYPIFSSPRT